ncbi:YeeE/YedE family protein [Defluviimonas salinarum]|uniref:YeeE/YedE family protein n=1 Tax=Defluviimonas salinarum TaxID=2992147 RepID=A0ABT3J4E4_9RHOB|nr:YeeE/YedE family protein [Defluviimonas salinarum]MCW3782335.1 YeeE/YedE family protein [Defluviimonas salinarum]
MLEALIDRLGEPVVLFGFGLIIGAVFGAAAQHSRFCLRGATLEVGAFSIGPRMLVWIIVFATAVSVTQGAVGLGLLDVSAARQLAATGSLSGAIIGGLMFGAGMILARGCVSRLLVLSATGNLRAIMTGLVVTLVAQASLRGALSPAREMLARLWTVEGGAGRSLGERLGIGSGAAGAVSAIVLLAALVMAFRRASAPSHVVAALFVGLAVAAGWIATASLAAVSLEIVPVSSITFTGPSADTLMGLVNERYLPLSFAVGLVPGVFAGSLAMSLATREFGVVRFGPDAPMERYLIGAVLMGFGSMLAGGCAVGAAVSGGALLSLTAWVAGASMWVGALLMPLFIPSLAKERPR